MGKLIKGVVGLSFAAYCTVSAIWLGKNMNYLAKLGLSDEEDEKEKPKKTIGKKSPKWFTVEVRRDDSE